ncbi:MAG: AsmA-like C-terminal region-containing protein [Nitrospira sp.]|nr:AsmA-like C-terminal region-containing protein [Nitrospira sp.]
MAKQRRRTDGQGVPLEDVKSIRRSSARIALWGGALALLVIVAAASLWLWLNATTQVRDWLAETVSASIGKRVTISGPVTWTLSLEPTVVLKQVAVAEESDHVFADLATADMVEVSIDLPSLLRRSIVIPSLAVTDLKVALDKKFLEREAGGRSMTAGDASKSRPSHFAVQIQAIHLSQAVATFSLASSAATERVTLREAKLDMVPDRPVHLVASGEFRGVPVAIDATGGRFLDATNGGQGWWPVALEAHAPEMTVSVDGNIGLPLGSPLLDVQLTAAGPRLADLNQLLTVDWPALGPYRFTGRVRAADNQVTINGLKATLGTSDLAADASLQYHEGRPRLSATAASRKIDLNDFSTGHSASQDAHFIEWLKEWDIAVAMTCDSVVLGERALGSLQVQADLEAGLLQIKVPAADFLGTRIEGRTEIDVRSDVPSLSLSVIGRGLEPARFKTELSGALIGMSDAVLSATARGKTWDALLSSLAVSLRTDHSIFLFQDPLSGRPIELSFDKGQASLDVSGHGEIDLAGRYGLRPFRIHATTGLFSALLADGAWPINAVLRIGQARLLVDATVSRPLNHETWSVLVRAQSRSLDEFASSLPASGPFRLSCHVAGERGGSWSTTFSWQMGGSDGAGRLDVATESDRFAVTADLTSRRLRADDFMDRTASHDKWGSSMSGRGSPAVPVIPPWLVADVKWKIDQLHTGPLHLRRLLLHLTADRGRVDASSSAMHRYGDMNALLMFDSSEVVPRLKVQARSRHFDYGALLRDAKITDRVTGTTDLALDLTSEGNRAEELVDHVGFNLSATPDALHIAGTGGHEVGPVSLSTAGLSGGIHEPLSLRLQGKARDLPLTLTVTSVPLKQVLDLPVSLPWTLILQGPDIALEAQGQAEFQGRTGTADFHVSLKGASLPRLAALFDHDLPELGSYELSGDVVYADQRVTLSDLQARAGRSDVAGEIEMAWGESRPRVTGTFWSKLVDLEFQGRPALKDVTVESEESSSEATTGPVPDLASPRIIPDWRLPVESFHSLNMELLWTIKRLSVPPVEADEVTAMLTLQDGVLTVGPLALSHNGSMKTGRFTIDGTGKVPHVTVGITAIDVDYGGLFKAFNITDKVEGHADIYLTAEGRGRDFREVLGAANGHLEIVAGPATWDNRLIHLWASNLMTAMLSQAWRRERASQYNCGAAYIDIQKGEMETDALLIDARDHSVAAVGMLNLGTEDLDMVLTPMPKSLALLSLAVPARLTGLLAAPRVSTSPTSIAASKAWKVLDIAVPIGLTLQVPRVILQATVAGSPLENPCTTALQPGGKGTLTTRKVVTSGFKWVAELLRRAGSAGIGLLQGRSGASAREGT